MRRGPCLVALAVAAISLGNAAHPQTKGRPEQNQVAQIEQGSARIADAVREIRPDKDNGCDDRKDKRSSSLCAQWSAVDAARNAAYATWAAVLLSFAGTFLIFLTFLEQRNTSRRELRAYIAVEGQRLLINTKTGKATADLNITNNGETPAFEMRWGGAIITANLEQAAQKFRALKTGERRPTNRTAITLHGHTSQKAISDDAPALDLKDLKRVEAGELHIIVFGTVWYKDAFERARYTNFCFTQTEIPFSKLKDEEFVQVPSQYEIAAFHNDSN